MTVDCTPHSPVGPHIHAVVVGAAQSGMAAARLLVKLGARVRLVERSAGNIGADFATWAEAHGVEIVCGPHETGQFGDAQLVVLSPGVPRAIIEALLPEQNRPELIAETELALRQIQNTPIIGISGTSGKTTTASLCAAMLQAHGLKVFLGGNIGTPLSQYVLDGQEADVLVLELSSFQLQSTSSLRARVGVLLNISENHLDHHADMEEYISAKMRLFRCQQPTDIAVLDPALAEEAERFGLVGHKVFIEPQARFTTMQLFGQHNSYNAEAAWQACRVFGVSLECAQKAVAAFTPIAHRLERVEEKHGVLYVNDSKATTVAALKVALEAFAQPVLLLAGGKFKGGDLDSLVPLVREKVRAIGLYGGSREFFEGAFGGVCPISWDTTLEQALVRLQALAQQGDVVLLAPATASYDQYTDYTARGNDFKRIVREVLV